VLYAKDPGSAFAFLHFYHVPMTEMTSVLYSAGLNYQTGNPVRQEIVAVRREMDALRKHVEVLTEENNVYRKHLLKILQGSEEAETVAVTEFKRDLVALSAVAAPQPVLGSRPAGVGTVQGGGFRR
jgi:hypothetical protein